MADIGDTVKSTVTFKDPDGNPANPTTVTFKYRDPSGNETSVDSGDASVTNESAGVYSSTVVLDESGRWVFRWNGVSTGWTSSSEETLRVNPSLFDSP